MGSKLLVAVGVLLLPVLSAAQVQSAGYRVPVNLSAGAGMDYWSGNWGGGNINRWGPTVWVTDSIWHGLGINAEGHSMNTGGDSLASSYKLYIAEGGLIYTYQQWNRIQPYAKAELGFGSLSYPGNGTYQSHVTSNTWALGGGLEYHTWGPLWTRVDYTYDAIPHFHSSISGAYHTLDPQGVAFGETFRFGQTSSRY